MSGVISTHIRGRNLQAYAAKLIDAGFSIRVVKALDVNGQQIPAKWFVYEKDGNVGVVQEELDGYSHSMPVKPSREDGSSIAMFDPAWPLHVVHAEKTAQPENHGKYNGNKLFRNAGLDRYLKTYELVEKDPARSVPVKVVWQEIQQYSTVVEVELEPGMLGTKLGRQKVRERVDAALDELTEEQTDDALDENWHGPHRHIDDMQPIWDAVEPAQKV